ncbi:phospholipase A(1) DAD1, chloroplastic-like [Dendrobium catenatum]|uniref:Phospholipase A(1) DAD1, chloroplastic n=1 Tax=Dendrobium catenatum TaxID=906689 RepID=A0A2I0WDN0_9ASPA|nr:phospholipase A(1) DAD1, chloroplastic-like [Dendrobium catenatum]PKU73763.1 Phospholipase A(1) DAD1, chloroplastic [Dendrobium catenatum]
MSPSTLTVSAISHPTFFIPTYHIAHITRRITSTANIDPPATLLGNRWMEFQGANNWDGLLYPLNPTLRAEILRYGSFVQAAYTCCELDPFSSSYATCRFPKHSLLRLSGLPSSGYRVTRNLHATSTSSLPRWAADAAPSFISRQSSCIGFVAVCNNDTELSRLGRRDVVISLRGTVTFLEWLDNLHASLTPFCSTKPERSEHKPMVERGFLNLFTSSSPEYHSLRDQIRKVVRCLLNEFDSGPAISFTFTGHSLGAALAVLAADDVKAMVGRTGPMVTVVSFGGPRVGNASFGHRMEAKGSKVLRIVNTNDIITKVPGFVHNSEKEGLAPNWLLSKTGWVYADIGRELRLRGSRNANVVACHDLKHYLHLVNQLSDACPNFTSEEENPRKWRGPVFVAGDVC